MEKSVKMLEIISIVTHKNEKKEEMKIDYH
jgi:hypothetical protein